MALEAHSRRVERSPRARDFREEPVGAIPSDGFPNLGERLATDLLDLADLTARTLDVAADELAGELGFEHDDRESVSEDIVQIARDALTLRDFRQMLDLILGETEALVGTNALRREQVADAHAGGEKSPYSPQPGR